MLNLYNGDCLDVLKTLPENSIDSVVTDPPYGLAFMGKKWDYDVPSVEIWKECLRVLKPGGHLLSFGGTRTYHRMVINIEDAGFEIRDQIMWIYGSGFPKSMDISKAIDKQAGAAREVIGTKIGAYDNAIRTKKTGGFGNSENDFGSDVEGFSAYHQPLTAPATESAKQWQGWGTALKPANEPICLARKPISEKTVASNVLKHGTGAMNIDESRIDLSGDYKSKPNGRPSQTGLSDNYDSEKANQADTVGRWPANVIFDEEAGKVLDKQTGIIKSGLPGIKNKGNEGAAYGAESRPPGTQMSGFGDSGGASRFFYCAKTSKSERNAGLEGMPEKRTGDFRKGGASNERSEENYSKMQNFHPTVKPIKLMTYLIKLITPPNGICLDPFMGSGSTGVACKDLFIGFVGIERDPDYFNIASKRLNFD